MRFYQQQPLNRKRHSSYRARAIYAFEMKPESTEARHEAVQKETSQNNLCNTLSS